MYQLNYKIFFILEINLDKSLQVSKWQNTSYLVFENLYLQRLFWIFRLLLIISLSIIDWSINTSKGFSLELIEIVQNSWEQ